ncbi:EF-hand calcium-binding domain-containing protein 12 [Tiliqua scincoides]|uniref:EF-hand calcium-binding domain-containing protein 12 n=1 Tax=Tiliqua scincoides TaxID=71010 RepID=UPI003461BF29
MPVHAQQLSWHKRAERRSTIRAAACTSERLTPASRFAGSSAGSQRSGFLLHLSRTAGRLLEPGLNDKFCNNINLKQSSEDELANEVLEHCFQKHKFEEKYPHFFLKLKASRFGPPKSRRRTLIAPPMESMAPSSPKPHLPPPFEPKEKAHALEEPPAKAKATGGDDLENLHAWIEERKKLRDLLNNCVDLEKWLEIKHPISEQEESVLGKMRASRSIKEAKAEALVSAVSSIQHLIPKRPQKKIIPSIEAPYPDSLITLQNTLHKHKLKLVDIFNKVDKSRSMKFRRKDFLKVMQETKVPISPAILEDAVTYLTLKKRKYLTGEDIAECQRIWLNSLREQREQWKQPKEPKPDTRGSWRCQAAVCVCSKSIQPPELPKLSLLQVPPINTEPDSMHLSYSQIEMVGKRNKEMRRQLKRNIDPLEWLELCRLVRTGDRAVDGHCLPSTIEGEMGEIVDKFRLDTHLVYHRCVKICEAHGIPISEKVLKRALLYSGDRIIKDGNNVRKLRQPGGPYGSIREVTSDEESSGSSEERKRVPKKKTVKKKLVRESKPLNFRWKSFAEFKALMRSAKPCEIRTVKSFDDGSKALRKKSRYRLSPDMPKDRRERELMRMYNFLNPLTTSNSFWPGHLLDKLRLCRPEMQGDEAEALFSHVLPTRPVYPATYNPYRSWLVNDQGYVTFGDPDSRKEYYYI